MIHYIAINSDSVNKNCFLDESVDLLICDPPFGINEKKFKNNYNRKNDNVIEGYVEFPSDYEGYLDVTRKWLNEAHRVLKDNGSLYIVISWQHASTVYQVLREQKWNIVNKIIWKYNFGVYTKNKYVNDFFEIFYCTKSKKAKPTFNTYCRTPEEDTKASYKDRQCVWDINREYVKGKKKNMTKLPFKLLEKIVQYSSNEGDTVGDFFAGSFTLKDVCMKHNRLFAGQEMNFNAVITNLWENIPDEVRQLDKKFEQHYYDKWINKRTRRPKKHAPSFDEYVINYIMIHKEDATAEEVEVFRLYLKHRYKVTPPL